MCGFVGVVSLNDLQDDDISNVIKSLKRIINRGPNNQSFKKGSNYFLGHNRLQIIDLSDKSNQPLVSNDKKNILIFNGEIYNFKDLRNFLKNKYEFYTEGDGEVLLA